MFSYTHLPKAIILASLCVPCVPLLSQKKPLVVAILEPAGDAGRMNKSTVRGTMEQFITKSKGYKVVDRARADQVFGELSLQRENAMIDINTAKAIGKHLGADFVCASELIKEEGYTNINISLINVETGVVAASGSRLIEGETPAIIAKATKEIASGMLGVKK
jgi:carbon monoxide dehydrogenase subunit G